MEYSSPSSPHKLRNFFVEDPWDKYWNHQTTCVIETTPLLSEEEMKTDVQFLTKSYYITTRIKASVKFSDRDGCYNITLNVIRPEDFCLPSFIHTNKRIKFIQCPGPARQLNDEEYKLLIHSLDPERALPYGQEQKFKELFQKADTERKLMLNRQKLEESKKTDLSSLLYNSRSPRTPISKMPKNIKVLRKPQEESQTLLAQFCKTLSNDQMKIQPRGRTFSAINCSQSLVKGTIRPLIEANSEESLNNL